MSITLYRKDKARANNGDPSWAKHRVEFSTHPGKIFVVSLKKPIISSLLSKCSTLQYFDRTINAVNTMWIYHESLLENFGSAKPQRSAKPLGTGGWCANVVETPESILKKINVEGRASQVCAKQAHKVRALQENAPKGVCIWTMNYTKSQENVLELKETVQKCSSKTVLPYEQIERFISDASSESKAFIKAFNERKAITKRKAINGGENDPVEVMKFFSAAVSRKSSGRSIVINSEGGKFLLLTHSTSGGDKRLGHGSFKEAKYAINLDTREIVVVAVAKNRDDNSQFSKSQRDSLKNEIEMMKFVNKSIPMETVKLHFSHHQLPVLADKVQNKFQEIIQEIVQEKVYLFMKYYSGGDLASKIKKDISDRARDLDMIKKADLASKIEKDIDDRARARADDRNVIILDLAHILTELHKIGIIHRDLKPANIVLDGEGNACVADFGLACKDNNTDEIKQICGTPAYMAPEKVGSKAADSWAFGCMVYELYTDTLYYKDVSKNNVNMLAIPEGIRNLLFIGHNELNGHGGLLATEPKCRCNMATAYKELKLLALMHD